MQATRSWASVRSTDGSRAPVPDRRSRSRSARRAGRRASPARRSAARARPTRPRARRPRRAGSAGSAAGRARTRRAPRARRSLRRDQRQRHRVEHAAVLLDHAHAVAERGGQRRIDRRRAPRPPASAPPSRDCRAAPARRTAARASSIAASSRIVIHGKPDARDAAAHERPPPVAREPVPADLDASSASAPSTSPDSATAPRRGRPRARPYPATLSSRRRSEIQDSILDTIGDTPLVRLCRIGAGLTPQIVAKLELFNPGGSIKDRVAIRLIEAAEQDGRLQARRHDHRADLGQHRHRPRDRRAPEGLPRDRGDAGQDVARRRSTCCAPTAPRSWWRRPTSRPTRRSPTTASPTASRGDPRRLPAQPVREPGQPADALRDDRAGAVAPDRRPAHAPGRRRRHRRHDHRDGALPEGAEPGHRDHRRRPEGSIYSGAEVHPTSSRAWARTSGPRPTTRASSTATSASPTATRS